VGVEAKPFVSVIIPCQNDSDRLYLCLNALYHQSYPYACYEVIVCDNNSTEDLYSICQQFPNVKYCQESKLGSYAARNKGLELAKGETIAFTDSDCIPHTDWLLEGVRSLVHSPGAGIVGGNIQFFFKGDRPNPSEYADSISYLRQWDYVTQEHYAAGANLFTWRKVFDEVGLFDDRLLNLGDKDWGQRVHAAGWEIVFSEKAIVWHPARDFRGLIQKARRQTRANYTLAQLRGERWQFSAGQFLPLGLNFWKGVLGDENLKGWREKLSFVAVIHCVKWAIAVTSICSI
jgi:glycosyltransferase involved in cell wall biosynthesis